MSQRKALGPSSRKRIARIFVSLRPALAAASLCLVAGALLWAQKPLQFNVVYLCNGEHIVVEGCALGQSDNPANDCLVQRPDKPRLANGQIQVTPILHTALVKAIQTCTMVGAAKAGSLGGVSSGPGFGSDFCSWSAMESVC